ncbi:MAG: CapA family protein [Candidatus Shapirobacteria bacterium]|nr:CapA family protein [Candidatus Shapirobacteria bacterium]
MGEETISTPDFSTPQAPRNKLLSNTITKLIFIFSLIIFLFLLYFIFPPKALYESTKIVSAPTLIPTPTLVPTVTLGLVGDLGLGRHITSTARKKNDFSWSFQQISSWLLSNDFNLANLESPIIANCPEGLTGTFTFCGDDRFLPYLKSNKFVLNLANNHILNYGADGLKQTHSFLSQNEIIYFPQFSTKTINGISFGFLGYDFITYPKLDPVSLIADVKTYNSQVDWLIVSIHWGNEYLPKAETWRENLARELIDAGADIIHGHHPHVWQDYEIYKEKPIFYSFGNFIFDQSWSYETSHSQIAKLILSKTKFENLELFPIEIKFNSQPALMP